MRMTEKENPKTKGQPLYLKDIYGWLYNNKKISEFMDKPWVSKVLSLGNNEKLIQSALREISVNDTVLQLGATFGTQIDRTLKKIGHYGRYDILDICDTQIERCEKKYGHHRQVNIIKRNANEDIVRKDYDVILCFMLLHEVPTVQKSKIINAALNNVKDGGKVVFIDYHNPVKYHPLRYLVRMFNRLYQPFAEKLWDREIYSFVENKSGFMWRRVLYFGEMYQKIVADKKINMK